MVFLWGVFWGEGFRSNLSKKNFRIFTIASNSVVVYFV